MSDSAGLFKQCVDDTMANFNDDWLSRDYLNLVKDDEDLRRVEPVPWHEHGPTIGRLDLRRREMIWKDSCCNWAIWVNDEGLYESSFSRLHVDMGHGLFWDPSKYGWISV